ncbi:hypothetical protein ACTL6U_04610 [Rhodovibrionaceae bacterium A322]
MNPKSSDSVLIHIHVPKCAGSSINNTIRSKFGDRAAKYVSVKAFQRQVDTLSKRPGADEDQALEKAKKFLSDWERFLALEVEERDQSYDVVYGHMNWGYHSLFNRQTQYFSVIRPVISRVISFFNFVHSNPKHPQHRFFSENLRSINDVTPEFLDEFGRYRIQWGNYYCRAYTGRNIRTDEAYDKAEKAILSEIESGRFVCGSLDYIEAFLKSRGVIEEKLPKVNVTPKDSSQPYEVASLDMLSKSTRDVLESINQYDLRLLDKIGEWQEKNAPSWT